MNIFTLMIDVFLVLIWAISDQGAEVVSHFLDLRLLLVDNLGEFELFLFLLPWELKDRLILYEAFVLAGLWVPEVVASEWFLIHSVDSITEPGFVN